MTGPALEHVTANTGHVRASPRVEVAPHVLRTLQPVVMVAAAFGGPVPLSGPGDSWTFEAHPEGRGALRLAVVSPDRLPVAVLGVGTDGGPDAAALWADVAALGAPDPASPRTGRPGQVRVDPDIGVGRDECPVHDVGYQERIGPDITCGLDFPLPSHQNRLHDGE